MESNNNVDVQKTATQQTFFERAKAKNKTIENMKATYDKSIPSDGNGKGGEKNLENMFLYGCKGASPFIIFGHMLSQATKKILNNKIDKQNDEINKKKKVIENKINEQKTIIRENKELMVSIKSGNKVLILMYYEEIKTATALIGKLKEEIVGLENNKSENKSEGLDKKNNSNKIDNPKTDNAANTPRTDELRAAKEEMEKIKDSLSMIELLLDTNGLITASEDLNKIREKWGSTIEDDKGLKARFDKIENEVNSAIHEELEKLEKNQAENESKKTKKIDSKENEEIEKEKMKIEQINANLNRAEHNLGKKKPGIASGQLADIRSDLRDLKDSINKEKMEKRFDILDKKVILALNKAKELGEKKDSQKINLIRARLESVSVVKSMKNEYNKLEKKFEKRQDNLESSTETEEPVAKNLSKKEIKELEKEEKLTMKNMKDVASSGHIAVDSEATDDEKMTAKEKISNLCKDLQEKEGFAKLMDKDILFKSAFQDLKNIEENLEKQINSKKNRETEKIDNT